MRDDRATARALYREYARAGEAAERAANPNMQGGWSDDFDQIDDEEQAGWIAAAKLANDAMGLAVGDTQAALAEMSRGFTRVQGERDAAEQRLTSANERIAELERALHPARRS